MVFDDNLMCPLFKYLENTRGIQQGKINHPEGDVFIHSLQVLNWAIRESIDTDLILAAMLHDIGKIEDTIGHEKIAIKWLDSLVSAKTLWLIEHHIRIRKYLSGEMHKLSSVLELAQHPWLPELVQLTRWDIKGRVPGYIPHYNKENILLSLNRAATSHFFGLNTI